MNTSAQKILIACVSATLFILSIVYCSFYTGRDIAERRFPLVNAAMEIKLSSSVAHLWLEEAILGDKSIDIANIFANLDKAEWYIRAMLEGNANEKVSIQAVKIAKLREQLKITLDNILHIRQISQDRLASKPSSKAGSAIDQEFDQAFLQLHASTNIIEKGISQEIYRELKTFHYVSQILLVVIIFLGGCTFFLFSRYNNKNTKLINALRNSEDQISQSKNQLLDIINGAKLGFWDWDYKNKTLLVNDEWLTMLGLTSKNFNNHIDDWHERIHPNDKKRILNIIQAHIESGENYVIEYRMKHADGSWVWIQGSGSVVEYNLSMEPVRLCGTHQNITTRKSNEGQLKLAASVFTHAHEDISITDASGTIIDVNKTFTSTTGYSREEAIGHNPRFLQSGRQPPEFYEAMWADLIKHGHWCGELWNRRKNGEIYAEIKTISAIYNENNNISHYVALGSDITSIKEHQHQLEHIARYDLLTNLPNRTLLADRLSQAMLQCGRHQKSIAVAFINLDGFKGVNDKYGHAVGDELLITIAKRMKQVLREGDNLSRINGDEFIAVLTDLTSIKDSELILDRFLLAASEPVLIDSLIINISASIGVTLYPQDNSNADQLIRHADQAMYIAKAEGKNKYHIFDTAQDEAMKIKRENLEAIRNAIDNQEFVLYYQPKVNMREGLVTGFEALIRWQHPKRGLLSPIEFLPLIENNTMMVELGEWVIDTALSQINQWQNLNLNLPLNISVNIAALQIQQPNFALRLAKLLKAYPNVKPELLELEILETSSLDNVTHVSKTMNQCIELGVKFALDDFGTGYSSLTYLRRLPTSLIKIDQSFVRDMLDNDDDLAIIESVIALAKLFNREVISEGVETAQHGRALLQMGCELAQGFGISRPIPANEIPEWVNTWKPDTSWQL